MLNHPPRTIIWSPFCNLPAIGVKIIRNIGVKKTCRLGKTENPNKMIHAIAMFAKAMTPNTIFVWSVKNFKNSSKAPLSSCFDKRPR